MPEKHNAERRERYAKAVEQLGDKKAPVRMGGVGTLVELVDECLEDASLEYNERIAEGQIIINDLCAYIRAPFALASEYDELIQDSPTTKGLYKNREQEFYIHKAELQAEADVRLSIMKEIHARLQGPDENTPGTWSDFEYDFSGTTFFYPVDLTYSYYAKPVNFNGSTYWDQTAFRGSIYRGAADFSGSTYRGCADFGYSTYWDSANFYESTYQGLVDFHESTYRGESNFRESTYGDWASFYDSTYQGVADFHSSTYRGAQEVNFSKSTYRSCADFHGSAYWGSADFSESTYQDEANFSGSAYRDGAEFRESTYQNEVDFSCSAYWGWADFNYSTYQGRADFHDSVYREGADFRHSTYQDQVFFRGSLYQDLGHFSGSTYQNQADFSESIYQGEANCDSSTFQGPVNFSGSMYRGEADFSESMYEDITDCSESIFCQKTYFGKREVIGSYSQFTQYSPTLYHEIRHKNTLFGSSDNDFLVEDNSSPIVLNDQGLPLKCDFLTVAQKEYLENKFQKIEETSNKLLEENTFQEEREITEMLWSFTQELHNWRREVTALPSGSPNSTGAAPQQAKLKRTEEEVPWFPADGEALSLLDDYRKNGNDHAKIYAVIKDILESHEHQIKILAEQTQQYIENAFKERMAERRGRYTKAVEQLGNASAPVRMGGVYTLIGLADEWLLDKSLERLERVREGQVIINNLCTYIRSPFALTSHYDELTQDSPTAEGLYKNREQEFYIHKAELQAEADVRLSIIKEIRHRLQGPDKNTPGTWSDFEYDFSGSTFFYPVDLTNSYYAKPVNFSGSTYQDWVDFSNSIYQSRADFNDSIYRSWADFRDSIYQGRVDFNSSTYQNVVYFSDSTYRGEVCFNKSTYQDFVYFDRSIYQSWADFYDSTYQDEASFTGSTYLDMVSFFDSTYQEVVSFSDSAYWNGGGFSNSIYQGEVDFSNSIYVGGIGFSNSAYRGKANFSGSIYQGQVGLSKSTYEDEATFSGSIFRNEIYCGQSTNSGSFSRFTQCAPEFYDEANHQNTLFGSHDNNFIAENGRGFPIYRNLEGLPLGCTFLTLAHKEYLSNIFQAVEEISNKIHTPQNTDKTKELLEKLRSLTQEIHEWREKVTTAQRTR